MRKTKTRHVELVESLAESLDTIFTEVPLGSVWKGQRDAYKKKVEKWHETRKWDKRLGGGTAIADVVNIRPSFERFCVDIFEVKASRADLMQDIKKEKYKKYLDFCHRFYYACESGICKKEEIPEGCGLYVFGDKGWKSVKMAKATQNEIPLDFLKTLIFYKKKSRGRRRAFVGHCLRQYDGDYHVLMDIFGKDVGRKIWDMRRAEAREKMMKAMADKE